MFVDSSNAYVAMQNVGANLTFRLPPGVFSFGKKVKSSFGDVFAICSVVRPWYWYDPNHSFRLHAEKMIRTL